MNVPVVVDIHTGRWQYLCVRESVETLVNLVNLVNLVLLLSICEHVSCR